MMLHPDERSRQTATSEVLGDRVEHATSSTHCGTEQSGFGHCLEVRRRDHPDPIDLGPARTEHLISHTARRLDQGPIVDRPIGGSRFVPAHVSSQPARFALTPTPPSPPSFPIPSCDLPVMLDEQY